VSSACENALDFFADQGTKIWRSTSLEECVGREQMFDIRAKGGQAITKTHSNDDHGVTAPQPHCHYASLAVRHAIIVARHHFRLLPKLIALGARGHCTAKFFITFRCYEAHEFAQNTTHLKRGCVLSLIRG
jgi:hypothetical protein